jgi:endonuclease/exonuclease/phosphatase (EEP) superfamily protein YafD
MLPERSIVYLALLMAMAMACARTPVAEPPRPTAGLPIFRLLTYNVNFGIPGDRETIAAIGAAAADLAILQETNVGWEQALRKQLASQFPHMTFKNRGGAGGLAILARQAPAEVEFLPPSATGGWFPATRIIANTPFGRVQVLGVHLRPAVSDGGSWISGRFSTPEIRTAEMESFYARLARDLPTVIVGDFNEEEDGGVAAFLVEHGFSSALARFVPGQFTWRWPTVVGELHKQLDHVYYGDGLDVLSAEIRSVGRSDHLPVIAVITGPSRRSKALR